ncbi:hypothetical protein L2E82_02563 [Cichorium intybus]|uniref:Uncharacterized protein n=1 Tax=Cichorium intybus TaxID=13427 RepID=A0ACB9H1L2_CICIN|nr:hypothetical protein L2E82_02563 [Cichorium intybus]
MNGFGKGYTASTLIKPNSPFQGNDVKKLSEEMDFKLKVAHEKRLAIKHFMSATPSSSVPKTSVPKKKKMAERNKTQTQDVEGKHCFPRSFSFDSKDSRFSIDAHNDIKCW